jgi:hypothetical protein
MMELVAFSPRSISGDGSSKPCFRIQRRASDRVRSVLLPAAGFHTRPGSASFYITAT